MLMKQMNICWFCSVKLVEQELWQKEEKGLIGILPVRDAEETPSVSPVISQGAHFASILLQLVSTTAVIDFMVLGK